MLEALGSNNDLARFLMGTISLVYLPTASEQGNVIGFVSVYISVQLLFL